MYKEYTYYCMDSASWDSSCSWHFDRFYGQIRVSIDCIL